MGRSDENQPASALHGTGRVTSDQAAHAFVVRQAGAGDIEHLARHRVAMFQDMGEVQPEVAEPLERATAAYLAEAMPRGEYVAWVAETSDSEIIGGAGVQIRPILPRPRPRSRSLELGPEALVLNVYVVPAWRRRGVANALMRELLDSLSARNIHRVVLHASDEGRPLYERLGFAQTNEMRLNRPEVNA